MANPSATITAKDNRRFAELIAGYWIDVAAELDLGGKISNIQRSSIYPTEKDKAFRLLEVLREDQECTYKKLAEALKTLGKSGHAKQVLPQQASPNERGVDSTDAATHGGVGTQGPEPPVFISYQWDIQDWVKVLKNKLEENGVQCWMDISQMGGGDALNTKIDAGIRAAKVVISCVTEKYSQSKNCKREVTLADTLKKPIIPLRFDGSAWPPLGLGMIFNDLLYINMAGQPGTIPEQKFQELLTKVRERLEPTLQGAAAVEHAEGETTLKRTRQDNQDVEDSPAKKKPDSRSPPQPRSPGRRGEHEDDPNNGGSLSCNGDEELNAEELIALSQSVTGVYEALGVALGLTFDEVGRFTNDYTLKSPDAKALKMLEFWFGGSTNTNRRETLAKALEKKTIRRRDLAQKVRNKTLLD